MKISNEPPPIYERAQKLFSVSMETGTVFTYGDTVHTLSRQLDPDTEAHEEVHMRQQGDDPAGWWERYFTDAHFRFGQELEAYRVQWHFIKDQIKDRNIRAKYLDHFSKSLYYHSPRISYYEAKRLIQNNETYQGENRPAA